MYHILLPAQGYYEEKKSKFYGFVYPVKKEEEIKIIINQLKKSYPEAKHYCYGSIISGNNRSSDDGEPASTAGKVILNCLLNKQLDNVLCVVVRYFGGTLLGTGGLSRAYQQACLDAINQATLSRPVKVSNYSLAVPFNLNNKFEYFLNKNAKIISRDYQEEVTYIYQTNKDLTNQINELTNGQIQAVKLNEEIIEEKID